MTRKATEKVTKPKAAKMPKHRLRLSVEELLPGEHGILLDYGVQIDKKTREVFVEKSQQIIKFWGVNPWPEHQGTGDVMVTILEDGRVRLTVGKDVIFTHIVEEYDAENDKLIPVDEIVELDGKKDECPTCRGEGVVDVGTGP